MLANNNIIQTKLLYYNIPEEDINFGIFLMGFGDFFREGAARENRQNGVFGAGSKFPPFSITSLIGAIPLQF